MSIFGLICNTVEGTLQTTIGAAKIALGVPLVPLDEGKTFEDGAGAVRDGLDKIGDAGDQKQGCPHD